MQPAALAELLVAAVDQPAQVILEMAVMEQVVAVLGYLGEMEDLV
jgi:hypothetical protein